MIATHYKVLLALICAAGLSNPLEAQPPTGETANKPAAQPSKDKSNSSIVTIMMAFDKNGDGKLTKEEITDERLHRLFDRADANKDGVVTKEELMALATVMEAEMGQLGGRGPGGDFGGPPDGGPGRRGPGGPGGGPPDGGRGRRGPGGSGGDGPPDGGGPGRRGPGGFGGQPQPGQIMPIFMQERLGLTAEQKSKVQDLQKEVDGKMATILTSDQKSQLKEMQNEFGPLGRGGRGPGGRGGPPGGGPGRGPGGPGGGGPPGGPGGPPDR